MTAATRQRCGPRPGHRAFEIAHWNRSEINRAVRRNQGRLLNLAQLHAQPFYSPRQVHDEPG